MGTSKFSLSAIAFSCFHSIHVPSEWGLVKQESDRSGTLSIVSIQLMSPASGDLGLSCVYLSGNWLGLVSIQLMSPASGDVLTSRYLLCPRLSLGVSIQLMSPASGDVGI